MSPSLLMIYKFNRDISCQNKIDWIPLNRQHPISTLILFRVRTISHAVDNESFRRRTLQFEYLLYIIVIPCNNRSLLIVREKMRLHLPLLPGSQCLNEFHRFQDTCHRIIGDQTGFGIQVIRQQSKLIFCKRCIFTMVGQ